MTPTLRWGALLLLAPALIAADWPQWRGANRDAHSPETGLLAEWPDGGPPLLFSAEGLGRGFSSLAVTQGVILTLGDVGEDQFVIAMNEQDGSLAWRTRIGPAMTSDVEYAYPGARSTPTVDGGRVYALGSEADLVCLRLEDGEEVWRRNLQHDFGGRLMKEDFNWRYAESPLVDGNRVVVTPGAPDAFLVALDKTNGEEIWRSSVASSGELGLDGAGYSSVVVSEGAGVRQYVQLAGRGVLGVEAETGRFLWSYNRVANDVANIPTPIVSGDYVFSASGYGAGAALLRLVPGENGGVRAEEVYFLAGNVMQNHHGGIVLHDGHLYLGTGHNRGYPLCVDLQSGERVWGPLRNSGEGSAAVIYADGRIYMRYQNGLMVLAEASPEGYQERGSFQIPGADDLSWSHPVIAGQRLYLREQDKLHVYDIAGAQAGS